MELDWIRKNPGSAYKINDRRHWADPINPLALTPGNVNWH
jgi:hypothetical protein